MAKRRLREVAIAPAEKRADRLKAEMVEAAGRIREELGADLGGFTIVAWNMRGAAYTVISADEGPVAMGFAPLFSEQALNRHVAIKIGEDRHTETIGGA